MMNDNTLSYSSNMLAAKIQTWAGKAQSSSELQQYLMLASNLIEYIESDVVALNVTGHSITATQDLQNILTYLVSLVSKIQVNSMSKMGLIQP